MTTKAVCIGCGAKKGLARGRSGAYPLCNTCKAAYVSAAKSHGTPVSLAAKTTPPAKEKT